MHLNKYVKQMWNTIFVDNVVLFGDRMKKLYFFCFKKIYVLEKKLFQKDTYFTFSMHKLIANCKVRKI